MSPSVIASNDFEMPEDGANLHEVVIAMICARDAMDVNKEEEENACFESPEEKFHDKNRVYHFRTKRNERSRGMHCVHSRNCSRRKISSSTKV
mmetsp:Transcript_33862/g.51047  ORF Transcript_33862/g.51047 Transcript_33862/m.51047 type:complete len:93 (-) Transcript_33862:1572-1850(-)